MERGNSTPRRGGGGGRNQEDEAATATVSAATAPVTAAAAAAAAATATAPPLGPAPKSPAPGQATSPATATAPKAPARGAIHISLGKLTKKTRAIKKLTDHHEKNVARNTNIPLTGTMVREAREDFAQINAWTENESADAYATIAASDELLAHLFKFTPAIKAQMARGGHRDYNDNDLVALHDSANNLLLKLRHHHH